MAELKQFVQCPAFRPAMPGQLPVGWVCEETGLSSRTECPIKKATNSDCMIDLQKINLLPRGAYLSMRQRVERRVQAESNLLG